MEPTKTTVENVNAIADIKAQKDVSSIISWVAPFVCVILGYIIWRFVLGSDDNFATPDKTGGFWPSHKGPKDALSRMYEGGIIVPLLIGLFFIVVTFSIERLLTIIRCLGQSKPDVLIRKVQYFLNQSQVDKAIAECDEAKGSLANIIKSGLVQYKKMIHDTHLTTEQKTLSIKKEVEEATALELPMLEKNLVFLSTLTSLSTLTGLIGTVIGMIRAFAALGESGGAAASELAGGISEALYNTALGIGTAAIAMLMYNIFTTKIDKITFGIDEAGFTLTQTFVSMHK